MIGDLVVRVDCFVCFFEQKTAYEMRISDWSSDVCSSDLIWAAHFAVVEGEMVGHPQYESDRARFVGRGRAINTAAAIVGDQPLSDTVGTVLDPIFSLRSRVVIPPGKVVRVAFWTVVASSRAEIGRAHV